MITTRLVQFYCVLYLTYWMHQILSSIFIAADVVAILVRISSTELFTLKRVDLTYLNQPYSVHVHICWPETMTLLVSALVSISYAIELSDPALF